MGAVPEPSYPTSTDGVFDANEVFVLPLEDDQANDWVGPLWYARVEELDENEWIDGTTPRGPAVHAYVTFSMSNRRAKAALEWMRSCEPEQYCALFSSWKRR